MDDAPTNEHLLQSSYGPGASLNGKVWCYLCDDWVVRGSKCPGESKVAECGSSRS